MESEKYRLYLCEAIAVDYEPRGVIVAKSEDEAIQKFEKELDDEGVWHSGRASDWEIEAEGYTISVTKNS